MYTYIYIYIYVCIYIYMCVCVCVYIHMVQIYGTLTSRPLSPLRSTLAVVFVHERISRFPLQDVRMETRLGILPRKSKDRQAPTHDFFL